MTPECQYAVENVGNGIAASLQGVDCLAGDMTQAAFGRLFGSGGAFAPALTAILTIYIALFGFALITGRSRIGVRALIPRMVTVGLVLTFTTSWLAYQSYVWGFATAAPDQVATVLSGSEGSATQVFAQKIEIVFAAIQDATSQQGQPQQEQVTTFSPQGLLWMGATLLLLGTLGVLVTARIALAVLVAVGPIFIVLSLFPATRGLFTGWLKGIVMLAITPLFAVLGGSLMLEIAVPVLSGLSPEPGKIDPRAAMAFFMIGAVHVALMFLVLKVAMTMVSGWRVFGKAEAAAEEDARSGSPTTFETRSIAVGHAATSQGSAATSPAPRRVAVAGVPVTVPANDPHGPAPASTRREALTRSGEQQSTGSARPMISRARGIGSRFRAAPVRAMEKIT